MPIDQKTFDQLKALWNTVGGDPGRADLAASVAFAESGGCQYALAGPVDIRPVKECLWTKTSRENSCGYWQINLYAHKQYSAPFIFDMYENARAAVAISGDGKDFGAWSTYTDGAYKPYLSAYGGEAPTTPPPAPSAPTSGGASQAPAGAVGLTADHGWNRLMHGLSHSAPTNISYTRRMNQGIRSITRRYS